MATYNGTITVGDYSGVIYGYARSGNSGGLPAFGSLSLDAGAPTLDIFYWYPDGSTAAIVVLGNYAGSVVWNGQSYSLAYDPESDVSLYSGSGLGGPYPTSGTSTVSIVDGAASTYSLTCAVRDVDAAPQASGFLRGRVVSAAARSVDVYPQPVALVGPTSRTLFAEVHDVSAEPQAANLARSRQLFIQSNLITPLPGEMAFQATTTVMVAEVTDNVTLSIDAALRIARAAQAASAVRDAAGQTASFRAARAVRADATARDAAGQAASFTLSRVRKPTSAIVHFY